jgi:hypothetical protein
MCPAAGSQALLHIREAQTLTRDGRVIHLEVSMSSFFDEAFIFDCRNVGSGQDEQCGQTSRG